MTFRQATKIMATDVRGWESIGTIKLAILKISKKGDPQTVEKLSDWIFRQAWSGKETVRELAQKWDAAPQ